MLIGDTSNGIPPDPAKALSELIERRCGVRIPKVTIEEMFLADWNRLSILAHAIHSRQQAKLALNESEQERVDRERRMANWYGGTM